MPASVTYLCATNDIFMSRAAASVLAHAHAQKRQHHSRATYPLAIARAITCGWGGGHPPPRTFRACLFLPTCAFSTTHARHRLSQHRSLFFVPTPAPSQKLVQWLEAHQLVFTDCFTLSCPHRNQPRTQDQCPSWCLRFTQIPGHLTSPLQYARTTQYIFHFLAASAAYSTTDLLAHFPCQAACPLTSLQ